MPSSTTTRAAEPRYALIATADRRDTDVLAALATSHGLAPVTTRDGDAAIATLRERGAPGLAIVDASLPRADGFAVLRALRGIAPASASPAVVVSAVLALRTRAMELRVELGIGAVISMQLPRERIDRTMLELLTGGPAATITPGARATGRVPTLPPATRSSRLVIEVPPSVLEAPLASAAQETARQAELAELGLVDAEAPPPELQHRLGEIARRFGVATVLVSLLTRDRQYFKAFHGLGGEALAHRGTPRDASFCRHVVEADRPAPLIVPNAFESPLFASHPAVAAGIVGSYVGVPLLSPRGNVLGTLCLVDPSAWLGGAELVDALHAEARAIAAHLCGARAAPRRARLVTAAPPAERPRPGAAHRPATVVAAGLPPASPPGGFATGSRPIAAIPLTRVAASQVRAPARPATTPPPVRFTARRSPA